MSSTDFLVIDGIFSGYPALMNPTILSSSLDALIAVYAASERVIAPVLH